MKMPEYVTIEIPGAELSDYADALCWAMEEAEHHVEMADGQVRRDYERDARVLSSLFEAVQSMQAALRAAQGKEPD